MSRVSAVLLCNLIDDHIIRCCNRTVRIKIYFRPRFIFCKCGAVLCFYFNEFFVLIHKHNRIQDVVPWEPCIGSCKSTRPEMVKDMSLTSRSYDSMATLRSTVTANNQGLHPLGSGFCGKIIRHQAFPFIAKISTYYNLHFSHAVSSFLLHTRLPQGGYASSLLTFNLFTAAPQPLCVVV